MPNWIELQRATVEHPSGFATVMHRSTDFRSGDAVVRRSIPIDERPHDAPSLLRRVVQRVRDWREWREAKLGQTVISRARVQKFGVTLPLFVCPVCRVSLRAAKAPLCGCGERMVPAKETR